jgi:F-type H+-transporting ATPase subunit b
MTSFKALLVVLLLCAVPPGAAAQGHGTSPAQPAAADQHGQPPATGAQSQAPAGDHAAADEDSHGAEMTMVQLIARALNFAVLAGVLVYFLRRPLANHLVDRSQQIRHALVDAKATREQAAADLDLVRTRLAALPAELEALKTRGAEEVKAEQARIKATAAAERERLLTQTRREIEQQYRLAQRALVQETAEQAAAIARARIERDITPADQTRLIDRYLTQVRA